jgi:hypothetical protein
LKNPLIGPSRSPVEKADTGIRRATSTAKEEKRQPACRAGTDDRGDPADLRGAGENLLNLEHHGCAVLSPEVLR